MKLISLFLINFFSSGAKCLDIKVQDLPSDVIEDIFNILTTGTVTVRNVSDLDLHKTHHVTYWIDSKTGHSKIENLDNIDSSEAVIVLLHGWLGNRNDDSIRAIRDDYRIRYDSTIISADYQESVADNYFASYRAVQLYLSESIAEFLCKLNERVNLEKVHVVGCGMGAQLAGLAGAITKRTCTVAIGRITGLNPAGPLFQHYGPHARLDESDALFVDIIHTNQGQTGIRGSIGHVDFYPNCGFFQPKCDKLNTISSIHNIIKLKVDYVMCNDIRSSLLFAESINNGHRFHATSCSFCGKSKSHCFGDVLLASHNVMGEDAKSKFIHRAYTLKTNGESPYGLGKSL